MGLIRSVALFLLLFCGVAVGAEAERRQAEPCANGNTHQAGFCPAVLSSASCSATGATTGSCSATSDEADGTRYVCATSNNTALTCAEIIACSGGAAIAGASAAETGSNSIALSGLTTDAAHYGQNCNLSPEQWPSNRPISASFTPADTGGDPYNLYSSDTQSRGTIPFAVTWPTAPTLTSSATVTPATFSANNVNGREITLGAGTYGNISLGGSDKSLILQSGASVGTITISGQRIKITGQAGSSVTGINHNSGGTDVLLDGIISPGNSWELWDPTRFALINSTLTNSGWSVFVQWNPANARPEDVIIAGNTILASSLSPVRVENVVRFILVDNQLRSIGGFASLRIHQEGGNGQDYWVRNNQFENLTDNGRWQFGPNDGASRTMSNAYFYDNAVYGSNSYLATAPTLTYSNLNAERNYIYSDIETSGDWLVPPATGSGNTAQGGYATPPAWDGVAVE